MASATSPGVGVSYTALPPAASATAGVSAPSLRANSTLQAVPAAAVASATAPVWADASLTWTYGGTPGFTYDETQAWAYAHTQGWTYTETAGWVYDNTPSFTYR